MRRAKPLLGTLVSIETVDAGDEADTAIAQAFARVDALHRAMSFHEAGSDLRRLARSRPGERVEVTPGTHAVLALALQLEQRSGGAFNACCAAELVRRGRLPRPGDALPAAAASLEAGIELLDDGRVHIRQTPWIDLGGIAKGFAVDLAVEALRAAGATSACVNAGGDLRAFGSRELLVQVRDPQQPSRAWPVAEIRDLACASSAWTLDGGASKTSHLVGVPPDCSDNAIASVTVFADACAAADALTKIVWALGPAQALPLLRSYQAEAFICHRDGTGSRL